MFSLAVIVVVGFFAYLHQYENGLIVTGMSDQVSWGIYIASFTSLVGVAAAAIMLVIPAYIFKDEKIKQVVVTAEGLAIAACVMSLLFVIVDLGRPERFWHLLPFVGEFNFPASMLAWDVLALNAYLLLTIVISFHLLYSKYKGVRPNYKIYFPLIMISIISAISIHTVTAFLFSSNVARPFWHTAILAPRFIASAFCAGPAFFVLSLKVMRFSKIYQLPPPSMDRLIIIITVALQINLFFLFAELFTDFYHSTGHNLSAQYLFFGLGAKRALVPWIWTAIFLNVSAVIILMIKKLKEKQTFLILACVFLIVGVWIEKGMGLIVPGFVPTPLGEVYQYTPTITEVLVSMGIWAVGLMLYTILAKVSIKLELGEIGQIR
ncbi:MAG: polysulfide reductase NrfD [Proteobacteria bacterium]|nr:polysulfide reductase NrfD [Pseudomonadota bacterium]